MSLFIYLGERTPALQTLQRDVDLEIQAELIEDSVARLQQVVSGVLQRSLEVSACQACAAAQWSQLTASGEPGKYLIRAGEAVTEVTCKEVVVEVRPTVKCFDKLPIMTSHDTDFKYLDLAQYTLTQHASGRSCSLTTALFFRGLGGNWFRHMGTIAPVPEPARDRVHLSRADNHLNRHLALYTTEELDQFRELQLLPAAKSMITHRLAVGLCEGDGACPAGASAVDGGGVYSFNRIEAEAEKAVEQALPFVGWAREAWKSSADLAQLGGLIAVSITICLTAKLLFFFARRQVKLWWTGRQRAEPRYQSREEYEMRESLRRRRAAAWLSNR